MCQQQFPVLKFYYRCIKLPKIQFIINVGACTCIKKNMKSTVMSRLFKYVNFVVSYLKTDAGVISKKKKKRKKKKKVDTKSSFE